MSKIDQMVDRFLGWKLPADFAPDAGATFNNPCHVTPSFPHWPIGTNLFTASQARAMFEHCLAGEPTLKPYQQRVVDEKADLDERALALSNFIGLNPVFGTLNAAEQELLREQNDVMWRYSEYLGKRIAAFE